jgi:anti-sigma factor RsiW
MTEPVLPGGLSCDEVRESAGAFVLGALSPAEAAAIREHLASCPEAHEEIAELGGVLPALAESVPVVEPPDGLKARIMAAAAADLETREAPAAQAPSTPVVAADTAATVAAVAPAPTPFPSDTERDARRSRASAGTWALRIAAVVAIVALGAWGVLLRGQLDTAQAYEQNVAKVLEVASQPGAQVAVLGGESGTGSGLAAISSTGEVTMAVSDLAPTSGSSVYTAWVIDADGVPVDIGSFTVGSGGTGGGTMTSGAPVAAGATLALTHEPAPGASAPSSTPVSTGTVTPAG